MSRGFKIIKNKEEYEINMKDGFFWMTYFPGKQINLDLIILDGDIKFFSALQSHDNQDGTFKYHESITNYQISNKIIKWIKKHMKKYTGCLNLEIIDDRIIEAHLRLNGDFYLYDLQFVKELDNLYEKNQWNLNYKIKKIFLIPIFVNSNLDISKIDFKSIIKILKDYNVKSLRIDNINSKYQKKNKSRLFMYDITNLKKGLQLKEKILSLI